MRTTEDFFLCVYLSMFVYSYVHVRECSCLHGQVRKSVCVCVCVRNYTYPELSGQDPINMEIRIYGYLKCVQILVLYTSDRNHVFITVSPLFSLSLDATFL